MPRTTHRWRRMHVGETPFAIIKGILGLRRFDEEFQELLDESGCDGDTSRIEAIEKIEKEIAKECRKTKA